MNLGTWLFTRLKGRRVGADAFGNVYYEERRPRAGLPGAALGDLSRSARGIAGAAGMARLAALHHRRAAGGADAAAVGEAAPAERHRHAGQLPPAGHDYQGGQRARATGDYEAWTPDS